MLLSILSFLGVGILIASFVIGRIGIFQKKKGQIGKEEAAKYQLVSGVLCILALVYFVLLGNLGYFFCI